MKYNISLGRKMNRMPPQPTHTKLARFVRRCIDCLPWVAIAQRKEALRKLYKTQESLRFEQERNYKIMREIREMMAKSALPIPRLSANVSAEMAVTHMDADVRLSVQFEPIFVVNRLAAYEICSRSRHQISDLLSEIMREQAHYISSAMQPRLADEIMNAAERKYHAVAHKLDATTDGTF